MGSDDLIHRLRDRAYAGKVPDKLCEEAANEIEQLCRALARIANQNATFSVIGGNMIVSAEPTLTDAEREAIEVAMHRCDTPHYKTLRSLLERL